MTTHWKAYDIADLLENKSGPIRQNIRPHRPSNHFCFNIMTIYGDDLFRKLNCLQFKESAF